MKKTTPKAGTRTVGLNKNALAAALGQAYASRWLAYGFMTCGLAASAPALPATEHTSTYTGDLGVGDSVRFTGAPAWGYVSAGVSLTAAGNNLIEITNASTISRGMAVQAFQNGTITALNGITIRALGQNIVGAVAGNIGPPTLPSSDFVGTLILHNADIFAVGRYSSGVVAMGHGAVLELANSRVESQGLGALSNNWGVGVATGAGGHATITDSTVITRGDEGAALAMLAGNATTPGYLLALRVNVETHGDGAPGVYSYFRQDNYAALDDVMVTTSGVSSAGLRTNGGEIIVQAGGVRVQTTGQGSEGVRSRDLRGLVHGPGAMQITTEGPDAPGLLSEYGATVEATAPGGSVVTHGDRSSGVKAQIGGMLDVASYSVETTGSDSYGAEALGYLNLPDRGGPSATVRGGSITTRGQGAFGGFAHDQGRVTFSDGLRVDTYGVGSHGLVASDDTSADAATADAINSTVVTHGNGAAGLWVTGTGTVTTSGGAKVETHGDDATAALTSVSAGGVGGTMSLADTALLTHGADSAGLTSRGGNMAVGSGVTVETFGERSSAVVLAGTDAVSPTFDAGFTARTYGAESHGLSLREGATYTLTPDPGALALNNLQLAGAGSAVVHSQDAGSVLTLGAGIDLSRAQLGVQALGAKAQDGGRIVFTADTTTGGTQIVALGSTGVATLEFQEGSDAIGSAALIDSGGALDLSSRASALDLGSLEGAGAVHLGANDLVAGGNNGSTLFSGTIDGSGNVRKTGTGTWTLRGNQVFQYGGDTFVDSGVLRLADITDSATFSRRFVLNGGWLDLSGGTGVSEPPDREWRELDLVQGTPGAGGGVIGSSDKVVYDVAGGDAQAIDYTLGGATSAEQGIFVEKRGEGVLDLRGVNNYAGNTRVLGGALRVTQDANLGNRELGREVVLDGGGLDIQGDVAAVLRTIELGQNATVNVGDAYTGTWAGAMDTGACPCMLTKTGGGTLVLGNTTHLGGLALQGGTTQVNGGLVGGAATAISASAGSTSTMTLNGSRVAGSARAVEAAAGANLRLQAADTRIEGDMRAGGVDARLNAGLSGASQFTGVTSQETGGRVDLQLDDAESQWLLTGDSTVQDLSNRGMISFGPGTGGYRKLDVMGDYTGGGRVGFNTELNLGGPLADQKTDRLLIRGNVTGPSTAISVNATGSGANTNIGNSHQYVASEGISLVQVTGDSTLDAFKLDSGGLPYVAAQGSAFQYRLFGYGPGSPYGLADPAQGATTDTRLNWDYRLQTAYETRDSKIVPGMPDNDEPVRRMLVDQAPSYAIVGLALQRYGYFVTTNLQQRLSDMAMATDRTPRPRIETYGRVIGENLDYRSDRSWEDYGGTFEQTHRAAQVGASVRVSRNSQGELRVGGAMTIGSLKATPSSGAPTRLQSDAQSLSLTGQWSNPQGWYANAVMTATHYSGNVTVGRARAGRVKANGVDFSVEAGKTYTLSNGLELTPNAQLSANFLRPDNTHDKDAGAVRIESRHTYTARIGGRLAKPLQNSVSWKPYVTVGLAQTWSGKGAVRIGDDANLNAGKTGASAFLGVGASGQMTKSLAVYGEVAREARIGSGGFSGTAANIGVRYAF